VARARKRTRNRAKAARFFLLAFLALLIAGFIARRSIPLLMKAHTRPAAVPVQGGDSAKEPGLARAGENLHPPVTAGRPEGGAKQLAAHSTNTVHSRVLENPAGEQLTGAERRRLDNLIKERSR
jgi:hypothetical protein